jgi:hypothetical protein
MQSKNFVRSEKNSHESCAALNTLYKKEETLVKITYLFNLHPQLSSRNPLSPSLRNHSNGCSCRLNGVSEKKRKKYIKQNGKMKGLEANEIER